MKTPPTRFTSEGCKVGKLPELLSSLVYMQQARSQLLMSCLVARGDLSYPRVTALYNTLVALHFLRIFNVKPSLICT